MAEGHTRYCGTGMRVARARIAISGISSSLNCCVTFIAVTYTIYKRGRGPRTAGWRLRRTFCFKRIESPVAGVSPWRLGFDPSPVHRRFMLHKVALGSVFLPVLRVFLIIIIPQMLHNHLRLNNVLIRRTSGQGLRTLKQSKVAADIEEQWTGFGSLFSDFKGLTVLVQWAYFNAAFFYYPQAFCHRN
jgi:hypothetical protein